MVARGDLFSQGPGACPFVALDNDRDKRSDQPDYRHRCYAEPTPQPRALAHQEAYCLSPSFPACPIFQDWAARAAARPVSAPLANGDRDAAAAAVAGFAAVEASGAVDDSDVAGTPEPVRPDTPEDTPAPAPQGEEQLAAFDAPVVDDSDLLQPSVEPDPDLPPPYEPFATEDVPPVPPFLADRPAAPLSEEYVAAAVAADDASAAAADDAAEVVAAPRSSATGSPQVDRVRREDVVPSWEIDGRYGAQPGSEPPDERSGSNLLTAIAVIAILALGVAGVIFLPGLLAGGPAQTTRPSVSSLPSPSGSISPSATLATPTALATSSATPGEPTATPAPTPSPRFYRIKSGDTLARIARRNDITIADIIAANPEITDPNDIFVGQLIVIPPPLPTAAP